jgi:hypothetical protein
MDPEKLPAPIQRAIALAARWGVKVSDTAPYGAKYHTGPRHASLVWPRGPIVLSSAVDHRARAYQLEAATDIVHDLGHLLVGGKSIHKQKELEGPGLALDWAHCRMLRLPFSVLMEDFVVTDSREWRQYSTQERHKFLVHSRKVAIKAGLLKPDGTPNIRRIFE